MKNNADIIIDLTVTGKFNLEDLEIEMLEIEGVNIEKKTHPPVVFACFDWIIPPMIFAFFTKSYFDGFLSKAGEDHYEILKKWICNLNSKFKGIRTQTVTASMSPEKIDKNSKVPNSFFGIYFMTPKSNRLKIYMPDCEKTDEDMKALNNLLDDLRKLYSKPESKFAQKIAGLSDKAYEELYAVYNHEKNKWEFFTMSTLLAKSRFNQTKISGNDKK
jgi:hypothetical protein